MLALHCIDAVTHGPKPPNEDAHGTAAHAAWVIDGATGVSLGADILQPSGAAWLAHRLSATLETIFAGEPRASLAAAVARAEREVAAAFRATVGDVATIERPDMPTACLGLAVAGPDGLDLGVIGDISILHRDGAGRVTLVSDHASDMFAAQTLAALAKARAAAPGADPWPAIRAQIRRNRLMANQPGGYNVVHPALPWADKVAVSRHAAQPGDVLLVASDGFFRLVDHFAVHDAAGLVAAALQEGLDPMVDRLRHAERADPHGKAAPRVKQHDDATAVLMTVVQG